jgi:hypothetical protein
MSFKLRNTLFFLFLAILVLLGSGYVVFFHYPSRITAKTETLRLLDQSIVLIPERQEYNSQIQKLILEKMDNLAKLDKTVNSDFTMAEAFQYIDEIQDRFGSVKFKHTYIERTETESYGYITFALDGEGTFKRLYGLLWAIEQGPKILAIEKLNMRGVENAKINESDPTVIIPFELKVRALFANVSGLPPLERTIEDVDLPRGRAFFYPIISKNIKPNTRRLIEVERAELRAIFSNSAIIADQDGFIHRLNLGDEIYLGYLTAINNEENLIEFTLNKGGITETFRLKLRLASQ